MSREEDPFVPTCQDLAGFWDMVSIQVEQIHDRFNKLVDLRKAGWVVKVRTGAILTKPNLRLFSLYFCVAWYVRYKHRLKTKSPSKEKFLNKN